MDEYRHFDADELAAHPSFRKWKLYKKPEDTVFWENWILLNPDRQREVEKAERLLEVVFDSYKNIEEDEVRSEMQQIASKLSDREVVIRTNRPATPLWKHIFRIGAAAMVILLAVWYFDRPAGTRVMPKNGLSLTTGSSLTEEINTSATNKLVSLPDESTVLLMPGSKISFPSAFSGDKREVKFSGEGFFEIVKNPEMPFFVFTDKIVTKVLGTSFTIRSFEDGDASVTVKTGSVSVFQNEASVSRRGENREIILKPNESIVFSSREETLSKPINVPISDLNIGAHSISLEFVATPVGEVIKTLEKVYNTPIHFDESRMKNCYLTASLQHEPFYRKLDLICRTLDARYQINPGGDITIFSNGCE